MKTLNNNVNYEKLVGAYFRYQRKKQNISLVSFSKIMNINKGFLSDLENGKRHFPEGIIQQFSSYFNINFDDSLTSYFESKQYLHKVYNDLFFQVKIDDTIIQDLNSKCEKYFNSLGFFNILILQFYESFQIQNDHKKAQEISNLIESNISCLENDELSIYYSLVGIYYFKQNNMILAKEAFEKSYTLCIESSYTNALNMFFMIMVSIRTNDPLKAYVFYTHAKYLLEKHHNFIRLFECDILKCCILTHMNLYEEAKSNLLQILNYSNTNFKNNEEYLIYHHLAYNALFAKNYDDCIKYTQLARKQNNTYDYLCTFIPYSYYKKGEQKKALLTLNNEYINAKSEFRPFLYAIRARIQHKDTMFEKHILKCYKNILSIQEFDGIKFVLDILIEYYDEKNNEKMLLYSFKDMKQFQENQLTVKNSFVLKYKANKSAHPQS